MKRASLITGGGETTSLYDGLGQRVQSTNSGVVTNLVYDAFGQLIAEYNSTPVGGAGGVTYLASDSQGSIRMVMDNNGTVIARRDYQPFGEEITVNTGRRTPAQGYAANINTRQQYAGMEKESSGLNHTSWRSQDSMAGRWTIPDPYAGSMRLTNPQTFNRYTYVGNDPVNRIDPSGLDDRPNIGTFSAGNIYSGGTDPLDYPTLNISNVVTLRPLMTLQTKRPRISSQEKPLSKEHIKAAERGLSKCINKNQERHLKALDALGTGTKGITIIEDPKRGLFVGFVGAVFQVIRKGGKIALAPTVGGALGAIGLDAALNALYNGVSYGVSLYDLLEAREAEIVNCHEINEERYGVSFRPYNSNSAFPSIYSLHPRRVPGANSW